MAPEILPTGAFYDLKIRFNNSFEFFLPPFDDPEGNPVFILLDSNPNLINQYSLIKSESVVFYPTQWNMVGPYDVQLFLTDTNNFTVYTFKLEVTNGPPYWKSKKPGNQKVRLNDMKEFMIPEYVDDENNPVMIIQSLPSFVTFNNDKYTLKPTVPKSDIGWFTIKG
jgi:hypothetical protein